MKVIKIEPNNTTGYEGMNKGRVTVLFHSPQCMHCIALREQWEPMKAKLASNPNVSIYEVNAEAMGEVKMPLANGVFGFPTVMNVKDGQQLEVYEGERTPDAMAEFILKNSKINVGNGDVVKKTKKPKTAKKSNNKKKLTGKNGKKTNNKAKTAKKTNKKKK